MKQSLYAKANDWGEYQSTTTKYEYKYYDHSISVCNIVPGMYKIIVHTSIWHNNIVTLIKVLVLA